MAMSAFRVGSVYFNLAIRLGKDLQCRIPLQLNDAEHFSDWVSLRGRSERHQINYRYFRVEIDRNDGRTVSGT